MGNEGKYSLKGLYAVFAGLLLALAGAIIGALVNGMILVNFGENEVGLYIRIGTSAILALSYILVIAGTNSVKTHSEKFAKACKYCILEFVSEIFLAGILLGTFVYNIGGSARDITNPDSSKTLAILGFAAVFVFMLWIFRMLSIKNLMGGCADVAAEHDDRKYSRKCTLTWVIYILLNIIIMIGIVSLTAFGYKLAKGRWDQFGESINTLPKLLGLEINEIYAIVTLIGVFTLLNFIIVVMVTFRVRGTYSRFHGIPVAAKYDGNAGMIGGENGENSSISDIKPKTLSTLNPFSGERANGDTSPLDNIQKSNENPKLSDTIVMAPKKGKNRLAEPKERDKESAPAVTGSEKDGKSVKSKAERSVATRGSGDLKSNLPGKPEIPEIAVTGSGKELNSAAIDKLFEEALNNESKSDFEQSNPEPGESGVTRGQNNSEPGESGATRGQNNPETDESGITRGQSNPETD